VKKDNHWGKFGMYSGLAFVLPISCWLGYTAGQWLDARYHTTQSANIGLMLGLAAGLWETYRQVSRMEKSDQ